MAVEQRYSYRNTGTESKPVWTPWLQYTVANAVLMSDTDDTTIVEYVNQKIADLIGSAPETYDTLQEIAAWIEGHSDIEEALNAAIGNKADKNHVHANATADADGFMSSEDYSKLLGIEAGANKYVHPSNHPASMITEDADHQFITEAQKELLTGNITYTNSTPIVSAHGGIAVGDTFEEVTIKEMFDKILYPYVAPVVSATVNTPANGGTFEIGVGTTVTKATVNVTKKARAITKVELFGSDDSGTALASKTDGVADGGSFVFDSLNKELKTAALNGFKITAKVTDADSKVTQASTGIFYLVYPMYWGAADSATLNETQIKSLTKVVQTKANKSYNYTTNNQRMVFAYPASYGNLTKIIDANNFDVTDTFTKSTVNVTCADSTQVQYNVYINQPSTNTGFKMTYNF